MSAAPGPTKIILKMIQILGISQATGVSIASPQVSVIIAVNHLSKKTPNKTLV